MPAQSGYGPPPGNGANVGGSERHTVRVGQLGPEEVEARGDQGDDVVRARGGVGVGVDDREVAAERVAGIERDVDHRRDPVLGEERRAPLRAAVEAVLERADSVEARAMGEWVVEPGALEWVADVDHRDEPGAYVGVVEADHVARARGDMRGPRPGEAVGLLLLQHAGLLPLAGACLDGVPELVCEHDGHGLLAEQVDEIGQALGVVVGHEVAVDAVERGALEHVLVGRSRASRSPGWVRRAPGSAA